MAMIYRYVDDFTKEIKYVGIVYGDRYLEDRHAEHMRNDEWCKTSNWRLDYLFKDVKSRTDAEFLESHYINKFGTYNWYNKTKGTWGVSSLYDDSQDIWKNFLVDNSFEERILRDIRNNENISSMFGRYKESETDIYLKIKELFPNKWELEALSKDELKLLAHYMTQKSEILKRQIDYQIKLINKFGKEGE